MRKIISSLIVSLFISTIVLPIGAVLAADDPVIAGFEIIAPTTAKANEAIDVTVRAIDRDKKTVTKYTGSILFLSDSFGDVVPSQGRAISFTKENAGEIKFSKGVIFRSAGKQRIYVLDVDNSNDIIGEAIVTVSPADPVNTTPSTETVTIITPAQNTKITSDTVSVSGKTKKSSKVAIMLNGQDKGTALSDNSGLFTKQLTGITQEKNILQVNLLDGTNNIVVKSEEVVFDKTIGTQGFYNIVITPSTTVEVSSAIKILVEGDPGMTEVTVGIDGASIPLAEGDPGKYIANTVAPANVGSYPVDVSMKSSTMQSITKSAVVNLETIAKKIEPAVDPIIAPVSPPKFTLVKAVTEGKKIIFTFSVDNPPADLDKFRISYGEDADSLSKDVTTYSSGKIQGVGGAYAWYIDNLEPKNYTFKIFGLKSDGSLIPNFSSDPITANVTMPSCTIGNVGDIAVTAQSGKSVLTWTRVPGAVSYNVYRISPAGDHILIQNVLEPQYIVYHTQGSITYDDFAIKALCEGGIVSPDISRASRVQTGPGIIALLVILSGIGGVIFLRRGMLPRR